MFSKASLQQSEFDFPLEVRYSSRARRIHLRIPPTGCVELIIPTRGHQRAAAFSFLNSRLDWIRRCLARQNQATISPRSEHPTALAIPFLNQSLAILYEEPTISEPPPWIIEGEAIRIIAASLDPHRLPLILKAALLQLAESHLPDFVKDTAQKHHLDLPQRCRIRWAKGQWGSCTLHRQSIALNAKLLLLQKDLVEFVIIHELCHLNNPRHDRRFYDAMKRCFATESDFLSRKKALRHVALPLWAHAR